MSESFSLYIDTSNNVIIGLLDHNFNWIEYKQIDIPMASVSLHFEINELLERQNKAIRNVNGVYEIAGPGSYTGVRLSRSIVDIFTLNSVKTISTYHHTVSELISDQKGLWFCNAFKDEIFVYEFDQKVSSINQKMRLVSEKVFLNILNDYISNGLKIYTADKTQIEYKMRKYELVLNTLRSFGFNNIIDSNELIYNNSTKVFNYLSENPMMMDSFYFRSNEKEFKVKS